MKQLKASGGFLVNVVHDWGDYYIVKYDGPEFASRDAFLLRKDNENYEPYDLSEQTPQIGDLVAGDGSPSAPKYRVLGANDKIMVVVRDQEWGKWVADPDTQYSPSFDRGSPFIAVRSLPDHYLKVIERP